MLNNIMLELGMNFSLLNPLMRFKECVNPIWIVFQLSRTPIDDGLKVLRHSSLTFNDHVIQDDAISQDLPQYIGVLILDSATNDCETLLKHTESFLHILPSGLLTYCKVRPFVIFQLRNCFDKCGQWRIDAIYEVVAYRILVTIDHILARRSIPQQAQQTVMILIAHSGHCEGQAIQRMNVKSIYPSMEQPQE